MNKKLDWFKFSATDWLSGSVQLLSDGEKGTFIDLIAMIWKEQGSITVNNILYRKLRLDNATACERIESYCELGILVMRDDKLSIKFLDNQIGDIETTSKKNSENAKKRWDKKKPECDRMPIREEKRREEEIRKDNIREDNKELCADTPQPPKKTITERGDKFVDDCRMAWESAGGAAYLASNELIKFTDYWTEASANAKKMRFEKQAAFDIRRRFATWVKNIKERSFGSKSSRPINIIDTQEKDYSEPF